VFKDGVGKIVATTCIGLLATVTSAQDPPLRDPMRPYAVERSAERTARPTPPRVSTILISNTRRVAVIDGETYSEGDVFSGAEIVRIEPKAVYLRRGGNELVMPLIEQAPITPD
jgi:hypothetical protein